MNTSKVANISTSMPPRMHSAMQRAEGARQQQLENYQILRTLALSGELEAFIGVYALGFEREPERFDEIVACWGAVWLQRGGAL